ncbi:MAG: hypothetical protein IIY70_01780, partial [Oscillospiraceae bacterium]|nr:hypothetical protein [Oscillospiraceae bacterium]
MRTVKQSLLQNEITGSGLLSDWKSLLLAIAVTVALELAGGLLLPKREDSLYQILWICDVVLIALCYLANFLFDRRVEYLFHGRELSEIYKDMQEKQQNVEADYQQAALRLHRSFLLARLWYVLVLLLAGFAALLIVPASLPIPVALLNCYLLWGLLSIWFKKDEDEALPLAMTEADYPVIYSLVQRAAKVSGCTMPIRVYAGGESVGILRRPKEIWILIDAATCALFTKQELYQALLHEFAHEFNEDTVQSMHMNQEWQRWTNRPGAALPAIGAYLLNLPAEIVAVEYLYYDLFASKHKEELADACAARWGDAQVLVNGLAKLSVWSFFEQSTPVPELLLYSEYAGEAPPENLPAQALASYRRMLPAWRDKWRHRLDVELPPQVSSHPIFRVRQEAFGVEEYSFEDVETDPAYLAEADAMLAMTGKAIGEQMAIN